MGAAWHAPYGEVGPLNRLMVIWRFLHAATRSSRTVEGGGWWEPMGRCRRESARAGEGVAELGLVWPGLLVPVFSTVSVVLFFSVRR